MSLYQRPIQPFDPVVQDQQIKPPVRFIRDNFAGTGQDSHTQPPAQDSAMWQALTNVMPITKGVIERRWGFTQFATSVNMSANRLASFQRDSDGLRTILAQGNGQVQAFNEDGSLYANVFSPTGNTVRSVSSRNYQYFFDGNSPDLVKWNGAASGGTSIWGINATSVASNIGGGGSTPTTFGPNHCGTVSDAGGSHNWTGLANLETGGSASLVLSGSSSRPFTITTDTAVTTNYSLAVPAGNIAGIVVSCGLKISGTIFSNLNFSANLIKNGSVYGSAKGTTLSGTGTTVNGTATLGSASDLWGGAWNLTDTNATNFGVQFSCSTSAKKEPDSPPNNPVYDIQATITVSALTITVYTQAAQGGSTTSGSGVGISSIVGSGNVTLTIGRTYYLTFFNANTGHFSDLTPASVNTGQTATAKINLLLATCNDPQVTHKYLLATADGGDPSILYQVAELVNGGGGDATTYVDNTPDTTLVLSQIFLFTDQSGTEYGVTLNDPPPSGTLCIKHQGRLWMAGVPGSTHSIFFSKGVNELTLPNGFIAGKYEESWPGSNYFDISDGAESVNGLLSDGNNLYIGSQNHIRVLTGNDPTNFQAPQLVHPEVGLINQEVWQLVFTQGSPGGAIWLTPDFRVVQSDFNTYTDIGNRIQDILNNLQPTAQTLAHASFVADGEYDLYILAVPYLQSTFCDLHLIYDMRHQNWFVWQPAGGSTSLLYNVSASGAPQWLFINGLGGLINQYQPTAIEDNGIPFTAIATTSWLSLGEPGQRKLINEVDYDGDPNATLTITGALLQSDFLNPNTMASNLASAVGPLGTRKYFLAARSIKARHYQLSFQSTNSAQPILLGSYNIEAIPFTDL